MTATKERKPRKKADEVDAATPCVRHKNVKIECAKCGHEMIPGDSQFYACTNNDMGHRGLVGKGVVVAAVRKSFANSRRKSAKIQRIVVV